MTQRKVHCSKLNTEANGLTIAPYPGGLGQCIFNHVSAEAWHAWQEMEIKLINELKLDVTDEASTKILDDKCIEFLNLADKLPADYL
ncbi:MAG: oxidative damage protection protein [Candidatus Comchoanobacterales bacterium]